MRLDRHGELKPEGPAAWLRQGTEAFSRTCPFSPAARNETELAAGLFPEAVHDDPLVGRFHSAYVGHAEEGNFRAHGSSGGMVSWTVSELLRTGRVDAVAHVVPSDDERFFRYRLSRTPEEIDAGAKSRYYPVEMSEVLETIRAVPGRYAVVGVPCFIKAVQLLRREDPLMRERIAFTLGLFCGHMKSARLVESFAYQMGVGVEDIRAVEYRLKDARRPANWYTAQLTLRDGRSVQRDWFHLAEGDWGSGFFQNEACNFCDDVVSETADISFGDAWVEPYSSDGRGTNVVIVRSPVLHALVADAVAAGRLCLAPVDAAFLAQTQAAGFRQRREGLAYRLSWRRPGRHRSLQPVKRVRPGRALPWRRKLIYRMRAAITRWSRRLFALARSTGSRSLYVRWARGALALYHALAYSRGRLGSWMARLAPDDPGGR
ncbi:coenzyme F420-reducing hydrogenase beta subunit [Variovorax paradoxus]|uniref:Coenzyme F420 hydrogenase/dehydrogenase, beta subunit C-terminal domain n=1 Tax=Variovorax paradoxus TaxID=34073 RepID=UPI00278E01D7|nr:Coenzyme F420 hydrogenase/dehydrogenase, beta subunit C-terminal domain [Variovorax paradoxus]MDQ0571107.1 coenzyme F420-reducing hydrogenase beta subunit [Variovorax paradoxus]